MQSTANQPATYEGRPLPRPEEEVVDQGLAFDVGTLVSRRRALRVLGLGAAAVGLAACTSGGTGAASSATSAATTSASTSAARSSSSAAATSGTSASDSTSAALGAAQPQEIPEETAGPYPGDGSNGPDVLEETGVVRSDLRSSFGSSSGTAEGVPMTLELTIFDLANGGVPFVGAAVYVWHCDREGRYSLYSEGVEDQNYLRGVQVADSAGLVRFTSIFPACYSGRWPHIHFEVYRDQAGITDVAGVLATSQAALPQDVCEQVYAQPGYEQSVGNLSQVSLTSDNVFSDDGGASQLATLTGDVTSGYLAALAVGVDTTTPPTSGQSPGGGGPGGPPGG